ncbi:hypothetical protein WJX74_004546 [Apatococcus lobatus]|uniref:Flavanone 4-reductase n=1 Tax=Apatococcus lobatus TaxID=904363 RepID=A0AAW1S6N5_9CHLO
MVRTAVVTGASGYVATELVKQLLEKGYDVRATVRSVSAKEKVRHLELLGQALPGNLVLCEGDLLKPGSFDEAVKGADYVFHTASPFVAGKPEDPEEFFVKPAVEGTKNVLSSVLKHKDTVKRVVITSSFAAIVKPEGGPANGKVYTPEEWNTESTLETGAYRVSKTQAERAAWDFCNHHGIDLVTINPTYVLGPVTSRRVDAQSVQNFIDVLEGRGAPLMMWMVDVRDVARAHVRAAELPQAKGRYLCSVEMTTTPREVSDLLSARFPEYDFLQLHEGKKFQHNDCSKTAKDLGFNITPPEHSSHPSQKALGGEGRKLATSADEMHPPCQAACCFQGHGGS